MHQLSEFIRLVDISILRIVQFVRWQVVAGFDIITELALVSLSAYIVQGLLMTPRKKFMVILAFGFRLP